MRIDLTQLFNGRVQTLDFEYGLDPEKAECDIILPEDIDIICPVSVKGKVSDKNNCMFLEAEISLRYHTLCDRCLDDIEGELTFSFEKMISTEAPTPGYEDDPLFEDVIFACESGVDIDAAIIEEIALELPPYHICDENCPGLCSKCGKKLVEGGCTCKNEKEIDPRLKILQKLLDNSD